MNRRPELLSSVILRQNPHNVAEWHKRVKIFTGKPTKQILTYTEAVSGCAIASGAAGSLASAFSGGLTTPSLLIVSACPGPHESCPLAPHSSLRPCTRC